MMCMLSARRSRLHCTGRYHGGLLGIGRNAYRWQRSVQRSRISGVLICLITASPESKISRIADCVVNLGDLTGYYHGDQSSFEIRQMTGQYRSIASAFAPLGTLFETLALIFSDAVISALMEAKKEDIGELKGRLTNME